MRLSSHRVGYSICRFAALFLLVGIAQIRAHAADLKPETAAAFQRYIRATESRMHDDLRQGQFLAIDRLAIPQREEAYDRLRQGEIYLERLNTLVDRHSISVRSGLIHHWAGIIFIPNAKIAEVIAVLQDYDHHEIIYKPDIRESKLIERSGNSAKIYLQFFNKSVVTVVLNANFDVIDTDVGEKLYQIASRSTRIAEVADVDKPNEHERPVGHDHGYMWRLCTYWRIEEKDGGVYVQNESVALTRTVPAILAWFVNPLVKSIPRNIISHLLTNTRAAVMKSANPQTAQSH